MRLNAVKLPKLDGFQTQKWEFRMIQLLFLLVLRGYDIFWGMFFSTVSLFPPDSPSSPLVCFHVEAFSSARVNLGHPIIYSYLRRSH